MRFCRSFPILPGENRYGTTSTGSNGRLSSCSRFHPFLCIFGKLPLNSYTSITGFLFPPLWPRPRSGSNWRNKSFAMRWIANRRDIRSRCKRRNRCLCYACGPPYWSWDTICSYSSGSKCRGWILFWKRHLWKFPLPKLAGIWRRSFCRWWFAIRSALRALTWFWNPGPAWRNCRLRLLYWTVRFCSCVFIMAMSVSLPDRRCNVAIRVWRTARQENRRSAISNVIRRRSRSTWIYWAVMVLRKWETRNFHVPVVYRNMNWLNGFMIIKKSWKTILRWMPVTTPVRPILWAIFFWNKT